MICDLKGGSILKYQGYTNDNMEEDKGNDKLIEASKYTVRENTFKCK